MHQIKRMKTKEMLPIINELLQDGKRVRITVTGMSMYPFLCEHRDLVELSRANSSHIKRGDIILFQRRSGEYVLHRVILKKGRNCYIAGDAQYWLERIDLRKQMLARVNAVWRNHKKYECGSLTWRLLSQAWMLLLPIRPYVIAAYQGLRRLCHILV